MEAIRTQNEQSSGDTRATLPKSRKSGLGKHLFLGAIALVLLMPLVGRSTWAGPALVSFSAVTGVLVIVGKVIPSAPELLKRVVAFLGRRPSLLALWLFVFAFLGLIAPAFRDSGIQTCNESVRSLEEPGARTVDFTKKLEHARASCRAVGMAVEAEHIDAKLRALALDNPAINPVPEQTANTAVPSAKPARRPTKGRKAGL